MEIHPQIHRYATRMVNCYLCVEDDSLTLIDASTPNQADNIFNLIHRIGRHPRELRRIFVTHADWDHVGSLAEIQEETGALVLAGDETLAWLQQGKSPPHLPRPAQFIYDKLFRYRPLPPNVLQPISDGERLPILDGLRVFATPGHTPDHHSFFSLSSGVLFAGDALDTRRARVSLPPPYLTADMATARRSARRLLGLAAAVLACGHGKPLQSHTMDQIMSLLQELN